VGRTHEILPEYNVKGQGMIIHGLLLFSKQVETHKAIQENILKNGRADEA
jgi:hypothetical protein